MSDENNLKIDQLVEKVNSILSKYSIKYKDSRIKNNLTVRRVRDYIGKGILENGEMIGKNIIFSQVHVEKLIQIRKFQGLGYSDKMIKSALHNKNLKLILKENEIKHIVLKSGAIIIPIGILNKDEIIREIQNF